MSSVRFRAGPIDLELQGSESFVNRQLHRLTPLLGDVDAGALGTLEQVASTNGTSKLASIEAEPMPAPESTPADALLAFLRKFPPNGDRQVDAALLFAYYLRTEEGKPELGVGDLIRCCNRAGVDTRNFNRVLGTLTRRGFLDTVRPGHSYQLSEHGVAAVETRM